MGGTPSLRASALRACTPACFLPCRWPTARLTARVQDKNQPLWQLTTALKQRVEELLETGKQGARIGAVKAAQRIILVQTRASSDPRVGGHRRLGTNVLATEPRD